MKFHMNPAKWVHTPNKGEAFLNVFLWTNIILVSLALIA